MSCQSTRSLVFGLGLCSPGYHIRHARHGAPNCTAEHGQLLIDAGSYKQAINEFT